MKRLSIYLFVIGCTPSFFLTALGQNLVPNPGFDVIKPCSTSAPCFCNPSAHCPGFGNPCPADRITHWYNPTRASPDIRHACAPSGVPNLNHFLFGALTPRSGGGVMGLRTYNGWVEYIAVKLTAPLVAGTVYDVSFWVWRSAYSSHASNALAAYFHPDTIHSTTFVHLNFVPQIKSTTHIIPSDQWTQVSGSFTATGGEKFMILGIFEPWGTHNVLVCSSGCATAADYNYDDVSVTEQKPLALPIAVPAPVLFDESDDRTRLSWIWTGPEIDRFEIQGADVLNGGFSTLTFEPWRGPESYEVVVAPMRYYRLVARNGQEAKFGPVVETSRVRPVWMNNGVKFVGADGKYTATISDLKGNKVWKGEKNGDETLFYADCGLSEGLYFVELVFQGRFWHRKTLFVRNEG